MAIRFTKSASKHRVSHEDALHAIFHAEGTCELQGKPGEVTRVFVGKPHPQALDYIEVIAAQNAAGDFTIFHVMPLSDLYRDLIE